MNRADPGFVGESTNRGLFKNSLRKKKKQKNNNNNSLRDGKCVTSFLSERLFGVSK